MKKCNLDNIRFSIIDEGNLLFNIDIYKFNIKNPRIKYDRRLKHKNNGYVEYYCNQKDSVLFKNGFVSNGSRAPKKRRKILEDILIIGSIMTGWNWGLSCRRDFAAYLPSPKNALVPLNIDNIHDFEKKMTDVMNKLLSESWQIQFEHGFHIRKLFLTSNLFTAESIFLSNVVLWEWLYPHLNNPGGATPEDECLNLNKIINDILHLHFPKQYEETEDPNIFYALRNQLAHSGTLPINRTKAYAKDWMRKIPFRVKSGSESISLENYMNIFNIMTQVIVLKTIGIDAKYLLNGLFPKIT